MASPHRKSQDQTAFDQSIIEFLDLWRNARLPSHSISKAVALLGHDHSSSAAADDRNKNRKWSLTVLADSKETKTRELGYNMLQHATNVFANHCVPSL